MLRIVDIFESIQGEGIQMGTPMTFIRCGGCNLACEWCDTKYAKDVSIPPSMLDKIDLRDLNPGTDMTNAEIITSVENFGHEWVCITGGEPMIQNITPLLEALQDYGHKVTIETNGTIGPTSYQDSMVDLWTASPKIGYWNQKALEAMHPLQLKIVMIEGMKIDIEKYKSVNPNYIVFQPCAIVPFNVDRNRKHLRWIAELIVEQKWEDIRILPQLHKYIWGDERCR